MGLNHNNGSKSRTFAKKIAVAVAAINYILNEEQQSAATTGTTGTAINYAPLPVLLGNGADGAGAKKHLVREMKWRRWHNAYCVLKQNPLASTYEVLLANASCSRKLRQFELPDAVQNAYGRTAETNAAVQEKSPVPDYEIVLEKETSNRVPDSMPADSILEKAVKEESAPVFHGAAVSSGRTALDELVDAGISHEKWSSRPLLFVDANFNIVKKNKLFDNTFRQPSSAYSFFGTNLPARLLNLAKNGVLPIDKTSYAIIFYDRFPNRKGELELFKVEGYYTGMNGLFSGAWFNFEPRNIKWVKDKVRMVYSGRVSLAKRIRFEGAEKIVSAGAMQTLLGRWLGAGVEQNFDPSEVLDEKSRKTICCFVLDGIKDIDDAACNYVSQVSAYTAKYPLGMIIVEPISYSDIYAVRNPKQKPDEKPVLLKGRLGYNTA